MSALGQYLLEQRWIGREQLSDALLNQQEVGGRLGTSLLEKDYLSEALLLKALSAQQQVPPANAADLAGIQPEAVALLPAKIASRHLAVPFRSFGSRVDIALARVDNLDQLDELSFIIGKTLRPHVAIEARLYYALEVYYRVPCPRRFRSLVERLDRGPQGRPPSSTPRPIPAHLKATPATEKNAVKTGPRRIVPNLTVPDRRSIPLTAEERQALEAKPLAADSAEAAQESEISLADRLAVASSPGEIGRLLLTALDEHFVRSLLFRVARKSVSGWLGHGPGIDRDWLAGYSVGLRQGTVFRQIDQEDLFRGVLAANPAHDSLARCWRGGLEHECLVAAVRVRGRMVAALYGDRGPLGLSDLDGGAIKILAAKAGLAFERLILDRKLRR